MKLTCNACQHGFSVDENNLDTEKVECPVCRWPNQILRQRFDLGYFGRFLTRETQERPSLRRWPRGS